MSLHGFNLLQGSIRPEDTWDRINSWVNNAGRIIIIIVEMIVIGSFVARVIIDTQTKNLLEDEQTNSQALAAFRNQEIQFLDQQQQFESYKQVWNQSSTMAGVMTDIDQLRPRNVIDLSITFQGDLIDIKGEAAVSEIGDFENALKTSDKFAEVQVTEIEQVPSTSNRRGNNATFSIRIVVKPEVIQGRQQLSLSLQTDATGTGNGTTGTTQTGTPQTGTTETGTP